MRGTSVAAFVPKPLKASRLREAIGAALGEAPSLRKARSPSAPPRPAGAASTVLVVDDNAMNRTVAVEMVKRLGCSARAVESGERAIEGAPRRALRRGLHGRPDARHGRLRDDPAHRQRPADRAASAHHRHDGERILRRSRPVHRGRDERLHLEAGPPRKRLPARSDWRRASRGWRPSRAASPRSSTRRRSKGCGCSRRRPARPSWRTCRRPSGKRRRSGSRGCARRYAPATRGGGQERRARPSGQRGGAGRDAALLHGHRAGGGGHARRAHWRGAPGRSHREGRGAPDALDMWCSAGLPEGVSRRAACAESAAAPPLRCDAS